VADLTIQQPTLPAEGGYTQAEREFMSLQPPGLWPEAQNTNFGQVRKVTTDLVQENIDKLTTLWNEMFPGTSVDYLSLWEEMLGLTVDPSRQIKDRRAGIRSARRYGGFRRGLIRSIIDEFLLATFGDAIALTLAGVAMDVGGIPLYSGATSLIGLARIYEDVRNFAYEVWIKNAATPDMPTMLKRLQRITPAGITVTVDNTHVDVLDYFRLLRNAQPVLYIRDNGGTDASGYGQNATVTAVAALAAPGLLHANVAGGNAGMTFNGTTSFMSVAHAAWLNVGDIFTWESLVKHTTRPTAGNYQTLRAKGTGSFQVRIDSNGLISLWKMGTGMIASSTIALATGTTYRVGIKKNGARVKIMIDGVDRTGPVTNQTMIDTASAITFGQNGSSAEFYNGQMDEIALYNGELDDAVLIDHANTSQDIATY
jgi:hypothetical protein